MPAHNLTKLDNRLAQAFDNDGVRYYQTVTREGVVLDLYQDRDGDYMAITTADDDPDELVMGDGPNPKVAIAIAMEERDLDEDEEDARGDFIVPHDDIVDL